MYKEMTSNLPMKAFLASIVMRYLGRILALRSSAGPILVVDYWKAGPDITYLTCLSASIPHTTASRYQTGYSELPSDRV